MYHGIYRDDGLVVFKVKRKASEIRDWLEEFQKTVNKAAGNQHLHFTTKNGQKKRTPQPLRKKKEFKS